MTPKRLLACLLLLTGCSASVARIDDEAARQSATSSHLANHSDVPITYSVLDGSDEVPPPLLAPDDEITGPGGAWVVPRGTFCVWRDSDGAPPRTVSAVDHDVWTMFTGYTQTIDSCGSLG